MPEMALTNRPLWRQGMFMRPQHFQQFGRSVDALVEARIGSIGTGGWGLRSLTFDRNLLALGKVAIEGCIAIMPDGMPISIPDESQTPSVLDVPGDSRDRMIFLGVPIQVGDGLEVSTGDDRLRFREQMMSARDVTEANSEREEIAVVSPNVRLLLEGEPNKDLITMPIARIADAHGRVTLDPRYVPPVLDLRASEPLLAFIKEFEGLLRTRGRVIAATSDPLRSQNNTAAILEFMLLQTTNRFLPLMIHYGRQRGIHPETLYRSLLMLAGDVSVFLPPSRQPPEFPAYDHAQIADSIRPLLDLVRAALVSLDEQAAIGLPLQASRSGIWISPITDRNLLSDAQFILSVGADMHPELLRSRAPNQFKVGPIEQIRDLTQLQLPGIRLQPLPVVPRELPYRAQAVYLQLDKTSPAWEKLKDSAAFALHISGEYPGLRMEFWAIRGQA
jgi:type VI secretion system protein ImpJ